MKEPDALLLCADICEEEGFLEVAELLRACHPHMPYRPDVRMERTRDGEELVIAEHIIDDREIYAAPRVDHIVERIQSATEELVHECTRRLDVTRPIRLQLHATRDERNRATQLVMEAWGQHGATPRSVLPLFIDPHAQPHPPPFRIPHRER